MRFVSSEKTLKLSRSMPLFLEFFVFFFFLSLSDAPHCVMQMQEAHRRKHGLLVRS